MVRMPGCFAFVEEDDVRCFRFQWSNASWLVWCACMWEVVEDGEDIVEEKQDVC